MDVVRLLSFKNHPPSIICKYHKSYGYVIQTVYIFYTRKESIGSVQ